METQEQHHDETPEQPEVSTNGAHPQGAEEAPAEERSVQRAKKWNTWVHVGEGAEECPDCENGRCKDNEHFHAFCRLPNPLQIDSIRDKANAAKARVIRQSRDPETDRYLILETDMETLREIGTKDELVSEILGRTRYMVHVQAVREVAEREEFQTIEEDQRRFQALEAKPEEERDKDEYEELVRHLEKWTSEIDKAREEAQQPEREALEGKTEDELIDMIRDERVKALAQEAWMVAYSHWEWYIGTLQGRDPSKGLPCERFYSSIEQMKAAPPDVLEAIASAFEMLESGEFSSRAQSKPRAEGN